MKTQILKRELPIWLIVFIPIVYMVCNIDTLPSSVPTHWNVYGEIDAYGNPWMLPLIHFILYILMLVFPHLGKAAQNIEKFAKSFYIVRFALHVFFSVIISVILFSAYGYSVHIEKIIVPLLLIVFMIIGNYMPTFKQNWFIGIRTPGTMSNENVWKKTHILGGRLWFWGSLLALPIALYIEHMVMLIFFMSYLIIIIAVPIIYSWRISKKL